MGQATRRRSLIAGLALAAGVGLLLGAAAGGSADDASRSSRSSRTSTAKEGGNATASLEAKLDQILSTQQEILQKFDAVMEELRIIKVRATLRGGS